MDLTHEMYAMDFKVFGYSSAIKERPDLMPPRQNRRSQLGALKYDPWSRNSYIGESGMRVSQASLLGSVKVNMRKEMGRRASMTSLKDSLIALDKDEILAAVAGIRTVSTVGEESMDYPDDSKHNKED